MIPRLTLGLLLACLSGAPALAADGTPVDQVLAAPAALSETELERTRGGFATPLGFDIGFGAEVSTYVDGKLALQTRLTWTSQGAVRTVEAGDLTPDLVARAAAKGLNLQPSQGAGVLVDGPGGGATAVLQDLDAKHIAGLVINNASNRDIRQETAINLQLPDFKSLQDSIQATQAQLRLQSALGLAMRDAAR